MENISSLGSFNVRYKTKSWIFNITDLLFSTNRTLLFLADYSIIVIAYILSTSQSPFASVAQKTDFHIYIGSFVFASIFCLSALGLGYYERTRRYSFYKVITNGALSSLIALIATISIMYFVFYDVFGRKTFLWGTCGGYLAVTAFRLLLSVVYRRNPYKFTIVGDSPILSEMKAFCSDPNNREVKYFRYVEWPFSGNQPNLECLSERFCDIVFSKEALSAAHAENIAVWAVKNGYRVFNENDMYSSLFEKVQLDAISKSWLIEKGLNARNFSTEICMRLIDILLSLVSIVFLSPIFLVIALSIFITDRGPVLFNQTRMGRYGRPFKMFKFRTMYVDRSCIEASEGFTRNGDNRVTSIGKLLRPLHLDELPQLINIFLGHMSIVGPRPEAVGFAQKMSKEIDLYEMRYLVRPGLTGHAQLMAGYAMDTVDDTKVKLSFDFFFLINYNIFFYLRIVLRTVFVVLRSALGRRSLE
ncbi:sugar transferase [Pseudobacteriovorax antillogorgiicola]|uniref:Sugar transferase involved in LPS biosynthesis (Colanic, teichoic acid) n=1 Tax=Pseudobacteriovorax antillogorgiicola TaxID=1513793 RepID=A0A1Y6CL98_9BACT|nr:sugar transferase [Pseudobacteriovorax antillogorgiicola]TCS45237.1 lipopolysaccharide/colanic/teichoic acid biosynthesis glycosyltransferase [Pseudobacteriovorax antillogorgiicola]SMF75312.1 Sugar transferase involved in LPS biosynthesis (colanic, teichoic acid) [Pseudobacteriovorax antillogorgiicola]